MSYLNSRHMTTPGTRTYWVVSLAMTCGGMTSHLTWQANTPEELGRMLAVLPHRDDLELLGVYRHELVIALVETPSPTELTTL